MNLLRTVIFLAGFGCPLLNQATAAFAASPTISWEVENRFRYFKRGSDFRQIAKIYADLKTTAPKPTVLDLENRLEEKVLAKEFNHIQSSADVRHGWAASIYEHTCGRQDVQTHAGCEMENGDSYLEPKTTNIILRIDGIQSGKCTWSVDKVVSGQPVDCNEKLTPLIARVAYDKPHEIKVDTPTGSFTTSNVVVKDILIVSFGDSFSAGEGNPERPVTFSNLFSDYSGSSNRGGFQIDNFPVREAIENGQPTSSQFWDNLAASWTNSQCHRSLYSQHTRAALQYALEHPHISVTFLNYSCTGAEVYQGILNAWWARDVDHQFWDDAPQLVKALRDLCKNSRAEYKKTDWTNNDRRDGDFNGKAAEFPDCKSVATEQDFLKHKKIDALLLSIGGNDVGFASLISYAAIDAPNLTGELADGRDWIYGIWRNGTSPETFGDGRQKANSLLRKRYSVLAAKLKSYLALTPDKIVLTAYPDVSTDKAGGVCGASTKTLGMDVHAIFGMENPESARKSASFVRFLHDKMKQEATWQGWGFADQHITKADAPNNFTGHGICAEGPDTAPMKFPRPKEGAVPITWEPFSPQSWKPYTPRNRWVVTPNDSFLTTNYHQKNKPIADRLQPLYAATLSGSFHPNALGHAALADSVMIELRKVLQEYEDR
jgi:lysophospholipase L1-like esterase